MGHLRSFDDLELKSDKRIWLSIKKNLWKDILHAQKWNLVRKLFFQVLMGQLRSFGGHLVTQNSNMIGTIDSALKKKPMKRHITCPKVRFGKKDTFTSHYWSLEVIWRSFWGHLVTRNSNLMCEIDSASQKT